MLMCSSTTARIDRPAGHQPTAGEDCPGARGCGPGRRVARASDPDFILAPAARCTTPVANGPAEPGGRSLQRMVKPDGRHALLVEQIEYSSTAHLNRRSIGWSGWRDRTHLVEERPRLAEPNRRRIDSLLDAAGLSCTVPIANGQPAESVQTSSVGIRRTLMDTKRMVGVSLLFGLLSGLLSATCVGSECRRDRRHREGRDRRRPAGRHRRSLESRPDRTGALRHHRRGRALQGRRSASRHLHRQLHAARLQLGPSGRHRSVDRVHRDRQRRTAGRRPRGDHHRFRRGAAGRHPEHASADGRQSGSDGRHSHRQKSGGLCGARFPE